MTVVNDLAAPRPGPWPIEQVQALAPTPASLIAAQPVADLARWTNTGCDGDGLWGRCRGGGGEPYDCVVDHVRVAFRCSCPSRRHPCKHALALLLLWARGLVAEGVAPGAAASWLAGRASAAAASPAPTAAPPSPTQGAEPSPSQSDAAADVSAAAAQPSDPLPPSHDRDERVARMAAGLAELNRWLLDRMRGGLADPSLAQYATWDNLAARLVDARAGSLANRVRRLAGLVGSGPEWHERVLAEMGMLHLLADGGLRLPSLSPHLADSVAAAVGWQVRQADVLAGVPESDDWVVMGRSDTREDRIEVRRWWLRGRASGRWAMLLSFAAFQQRLDDSFEVGTEVDAEIFRYPGVSGLRCLMGRRAEPASTSPVGPVGPVGPVSIAEACAQVGTALAAEPWLDRWPVCVVATLARYGGRWHLTDGQSSLPITRGDAAVVVALACTAGALTPVTAEWTPDGLRLLTVHCPDRSVDVGPTADPSFVGAA